MYDWDFNDVYRFYPGILSGIRYTITLTLTSIFLGTLMGVVAGGFLICRFKIFRIIARLHCEIFISLPILVLLFWLYFCLPMAGLVFSKFQVCAISLSLSLSAFIAVLIKAGAESISKSQLDVAVSQQFSQNIILIKIIIPQVIRFLVGPMINEYITLLKLTTVCSVIAYPEILYQSNLIITENYRAFEVYTLMALVFMVLVFPVRATILFLPNSQWHNQ